MPNKREILGVLSRQELIEIAGRFEVHATTRSSKDDVVESTQRNGKSEAELELAVRQFVKRSLVSDEVIDVFTVAGLQRPDISILSEDFLAEVRQLPYKNVAAELLHKLLEGAIKAEGASTVFVAARRQPCLPGAACRAFRQLGMVRGLLQGAWNVVDAARGAGSALRGLVDADVAQPLARCAAMPTLGQSDLPEARHGAPGRHTDGVPLRGRRRPWADRAVGRPTGALPPAGHW